MVVHDFIWPQCLLLWLDISLAGVSLASAPGPLFILVLRGPGTQKYVMLLDKHWCVHGNASFHHDIVKSAHGQVAVWCKYSSSETDDRIAS